MTNGDTPLSTSDLDPEPAALEPDGNRRSVRRGLAVTMVLLLTLAGVTLVLNRAKTTPKQELARVLAFVDEQETAHVTGTSVSRYGAGDGEVGSTSTDRSKIEGVIRLPDASRLLENDGESTTETVTIGALVYSRSAENEKRLADQPWDIPDSTVDSGLSPEGMKVFEGMTPAERTTLMTAGGSLSSMGLPLDLGDLDKAKSIERSAPGELRLKLTVRAFIPDSIEKQFAELMAAEGEKSTLDDPVSVTLNHGTGGELNRIVIATESHFDGETSDDRIELEFSRWGETVDIAAPNDSDLDRTPGIDENDLAAFKAFTVLAPTYVPGDYALTESYVQPEDKNSESCATVSLAYSPRRGTAADAALDGATDPDAADFAKQLNVEQIDGGCSYFEEPKGTKPGRPVSVGGRNGFVYDGPVGANQDAFDSMDYSPAAAPVRSIVLHDGATWLSITSSLPEAELMKVAVSLAPLDLSAQPIDLVDLPKR